jgi:hypothetical protein
MKKSIWCDIDGVLAEEERTLRKSLALPIKPNVDKLNKLYDLGWFIILFTGRSWEEYDVTTVWLHSNNVKYHLLICGKPSTTYCVDDRMRTLDEILECTK